MCHRASEIDRPPWRRRPSCKTRSPSMLRRSPSMASRSVSPSGRRSSAWSSSWFSWWISSSLVRAWRVVPCEIAPRAETGRPVKDDSRCRGGGLRSEPEAHEDLVDELAPNPDVPAADALFDEAQGLVQAPCSMVRGEDRQLRLRETAHPHPLEHAFHHAAAESHLSPTILDRDADAAHVAVLPESPRVAIGRTDDVAVRDPTKSTFRTPSKAESQRRSSSRLGTSSIMM